MEQILFSRHLDEADDLERFGRDAPLLESDENLARLQTITETIYDRVSRQKKKAVFFVTSPRIRAKQTAELVAKNLGKLDSSLKYAFSVNENLRSTEQGRFILPKDYQPGDSVEFLKAASRIFNLETHASDRKGAMDNIDYRFGDPVQVASDQYRYPELVGHFTEFGESYRQTLIRIYSMVLDTAKKYKDFLREIEVVIVSHGQIYHVLRGLNQIAKMINLEHPEFHQGDSVRLLWEIYKRCSEEEKVPGICMPLDFGFLEDRELMQILRDELEYLQTR